MNLTALFNAGPDPTTVIQTGAIGYDCVESPDVATTVHACENIAEVLTEQLEGFELSDELTWYAVDEHAEMMNRLAAELGAVVMDGDSEGDARRNSDGDGGEMGEGAAGGEAERWATTLDRHPVVWLIEEMWMRRESAYITQALRVGLQLGWLARDRGEWTNDDVIEAQNMAALTVEVGPP